MTGGKKKQKKHGGQLRQSTYMAPKWCHLTQGSMGLTETKGCP